MLFRSTIPDKQCDKLANCSITGLHLGLAIGKKAFIIYDPLTKWIHESHDIHFFEGSSDSKHVTIEVLGIELPTHVVHGSDDVSEVKHTDGKDEGKGEKGVEDGDAGVGTEELSGLVPIEPCQSGWEHRGQMCDNDK